MKTDRHALLLVEDDPDMAAYLSIQLGTFGYDVRVARRASDVPAMLAQQRPDVLLMDVVLPEGELAGPRVLEDMRGRGEPLPPVVFMSGREDFETRLAILRAGGSAFFVKPVEIGRLVDRIESLLPSHEEAPYHVLIVEDSAALASFYSAHLNEAGMVTQVVTDPRKAMTVLADFQAELILMDMYMPGCSGVELAGILRQQESFVGIPIVYLSAETDVAKHLTAMNVGADDFLVKPIEPQRLVSSVLTRARRYRELRGFMMRDSLTGLFNHSNIEQLLEKEIARAQRQRQPLSFAMIDIDHFKKVNDTHGHPVGDQVIRSLARLLSQRLRKSDVIGRYGGEEFAVILPDTSGENAGETLDKLREAFAQVPHRGVGGEFAVTFSCGIAEWSPQVGERLSSEADLALYEAKHAGRNRVMLRRS